MNRYINTERLGVIETERIVVKNIGWIFREQSIVDVGIDAFIEQSEFGKPTGRFIAVQIKTGKGNFHVSKKYITLYVSHIHYYYWLNLNVPIILVAHLPEMDETYWQEISEATLKKTRTRWKMEIPERQRFNEKSKERLTKLLSDKNQNSFVFDLYKGKVEQDSLFDYSEKLQCINEATETVLKINGILNNLGEKIVDYSKKLTSFHIQGLNDDAPMVKASIQGFGSTMNVTSKRLEVEVLIFSELYSEGFSAFEQIILIHYFMTKDPENLEKALQSIVGVPLSIDKAVNGIKEIRTSIYKLPNKYSVLKEAKSFLLDVMDMLISELNEAKKMAGNIIDKLEGKSIA